MIQESKDASAKKELLYFVADQVSQDPALASYSVHNLVRGDEIWIHSFLVKDLGILPSELLRHILKARKDQEKMLCFE